MTKKHFEALAGICKMAKRGDRTTARYVANAMADYFVTENPNFDRARFLTACGF